MTTLFHNNVDDITEAHLQELRENNVGEGIQLEYKLTAYGPKDSDKREFLKDVSSFANTAGGLILIGLKEHRGSPVDIPGVDLDLDREKSKYESLMRYSLDPIIMGVRMVPVPLKNGRKVLAIRIPKSWNGPHAVIQNRARLIYARNSAGAHQASTDEMRAMFNAGADLFERAQRFQQHRMDMVHEGPGPFGNFVGDGRTTHRAIFSSQHTNINRPASVRWSR